MFNFDFHNPIYINVQMYFNNLKIRVLFIMFIFIGESMANQKIENYMPKTKEYFNTETTSVMKVGFKENMKVLYYTL